MRVVEFRLENSCIPEAELLQRVCAVRYRMLTAALMNMIEALQKS